MPRSSLFVAAAAAATALVAAADAAADETVLGIYVFHRHGDRTTKAWKPTALTALGAQQAYLSGQYFRQRYVVANGTSHIGPLAAEVAVLSQLSVSAPSDAVLQTSAGWFVQGLYPAVGAASEQTLANGSVVEFPLDGYQTIPIDVVASAASASGSENSAWLQGNSGCNKAIVSSNNYFSSADYLDTLNSTAAFYTSLLPAINTTFSSSKASFQNAYSIYDYIHVSEIHNATLPAASLLSDDVLFQLQTRADQHEWGLAYNASEPIRAIAGSVLAAQIVAGLNTTAVSPPAKKSATRLHFQFGAYGSFMSLFGLTNVTAASPLFYGIADYASAAVFELVTNASSTSTSSAVDPADLSVRFLFSNGSAATNGAGLTAYPLFGRSAELMPWTEFVDAMDKISIGDSVSWCQACGNTTGSCDPAVLGTSTTSSTSSASATSSHSGNGVSKPVAGVIGALVTLVVILGFEGIAMALAGLRVVKKSVAVAGKAAANGN